MRFTVLVWMSLLLFGTVADAAESRIALVVGNGNYSRNSLVTPVADAQLIGSTLAAVGFTVLSRRDADKAALNQAILEFVSMQRRAGPHAVCVVYYAGHAVQVDGHNYLIPTDAKLERSSDAILEGVSLDWLFRQLRQSGNDANVVFLDASRSNPYSQQGDSPPGLAAGNALPDMLVAYAAAPGKTAVERVAGTSPFSSALAGAIRSVDATVEQVFKHAQLDVVTTTSGTQTPWASFALTTDILLKDSSAAVRAQRARELVRSTAMTRSSNTTTRAATWSTLGVRTSKTPSRTLPVDPDPPAFIDKLPSSAKRWALVIGVDQYDDHQITRLDGAENDAKAIAAALVKYAGVPPDQVRLLSSGQKPDMQPTRAAVLRALSDLSRNVLSDGLLFLSFAGHGMQVGDQAFLLPSDAQVNDDVHLLEQTALSVTQIKEWIHRIGVNQVVLILDACRNDPVASRSTGDNPMSAAFVRNFNFDQKNLDVTAYATLYATAVGERAYEFSKKRQGYFSWELVQGLQGEAANDRGEVTLAGLVGYVQNSVPRQVRADLGASHSQKPFAEVGGYKADQLVIAVARQKGTTERAIGNRDPSDQSKYDLAFWQSISGSSDPEDYGLYLLRHPTGEFAALARKRIADLSQGAQAASGRPR